MERTIKKIEEPYLKNSIPALHPGDTVKVVTKVVEGDKSRLQAFEGVVISIQGEGLGKTLKVRKISYGVGVEKTFPLHSPNLDSFEIVKKGAPRRAKLFYLRDRIGKRALKVKTKKKKVDYEELLVPPPSTEPVNEPPPVEPVQSAEQASPQTETSEASETKENQ